MAQTLVPVGAGVTSALGLLSAEVRFDLARTQVLPLDRDSLAKASKLYEELEAAGTEMLAASKVQGKPVLVREADMRYVGQGHEVTVPLPQEALSTGDIPSLERSFNEIYAARYGYSDPGEPIEVVTWKLSAYSEAAKFNLKRLGGEKGRAEEALKGHRSAYFPEYRDFTKCTVYDRYRLLPGASVQGPAIVEERECTVVVLPNQEIQVDPYGSLIIKSQG